MWTVYGWHIACDVPGMCCSDRRGNERAIPLAPNLPRSPVRTSAVFARRNTTVVTSKLGSKGDRGKPQAFPGSGERPIAGK